MRRGRWDGWIGLLVRRMFHVVLRSYIYCIVISVLLGCSDDACPEGVQYKVGIILYFHYINTDL